MVHSFLILSSKLQIQTARQVYISCKIKEENISKQQAWDLVQ